MYIGNDLQIAHPSYKIIDDISSGFNGSQTSFALQVSGETPVPFPISTQQVMLSVNGVVQEPDPSGSAGFKLLGSNIVFSSAPANGHAFFGVIYAGADYITAGSKFPDGTVASPSFTFENDTDTGLFRLGSGSVGFSSNGVLTSNFDGNGLTVTGTCTATSFSGNGSSVTHLNLGAATNTGTVSVARLGSGATSSKFLRGDNTWQTISATPEGTSILSTGESGATKFLREDGDGTCSWQSVPTGTTINNNADNRLITGSGSVNTLNGEASLTFDGTNLDLPDGKKIRLGTSNDLEIYHNSSDNHDYIKSGTGQSGRQLRVLNTAGFAVKDNASNNIYAEIVSTGASFNAGGVTRLSVASTGISVSGTVAASSVASSANGIRKITASTSSPSGGTDGDIWFKYTA